MLLCRGVFTDSNCIQPFQSWGEGLVFLWFGLFVFKLIAIMLYILSCLKS